MRVRSLASMILAACISAPAFSVSAQEMFAEPATVSAPAKALGESAFLGRNAASAFIALDAVEPELAKSLRAKRAAANKLGQALQLGFARDVAPARAQIDAQSLNWERVDDGGLVARLTIQSAGAEALRAAFVPGIAAFTPMSDTRQQVTVEAFDGALADLARAERVLDGATFRFAGNGASEVFVVNGATLVVGEQNWSPVVTGDTLTVEIHLAAGMSPSGLSLSVPQLSHLDIHPLASNSTVRAKIGESEACQNDILCRASPPSGFMSTAAAVARMVYTRGGSSYLCTGTLLNNSNSPKKVLFYTANHCISTSTVASTLQTYWFYHASACNGSTVNSGARTLTGGAWLRYNNASRDVTLLELKNAPPSGAVYGGWNAGTLSNVAIEGIHHPAGDVKKYSLGNKIGNESLDGMGPFHKVRWFDGVTEGGSSGSGLFTVNASGAYQLRGGLYGGYSFCSAQTSPDYYSRLSDVWTSLQPYLAP